MKRNVSSMLFSIMLLGLIGFGLAHYGGVIFIKTAKACDVYCGPQPHGGKCGSNLCDPGVGPADAGCEGGSYCANISAQEMWCAAYGGGGTMLTENAGTCEYLGVCGIAHYSCIRGYAASKDSSDPAKWTWRCYNDGNGTQFASCSELKGSINGLCDNTTNNGCTDGTSSDTPLDSASQYLWTCLGINGGNPDSCALNKPSCSCNTTVNNGCSLGTLTDLPDSSTDYLWQCGGDTCNPASCTKPKPIDGVCGGSENACIPGLSVNLPDDADYYIWRCDGSNGGASPTCKIPKGISPTVSISASPTCAPNNGPTTINWSSTNASSCSITKAGNPFDTTLNGSKSSGNLTASTLFSITCKNLAGSTSDSVTVPICVVPPPLPTVNITAVKNLVVYNTGTTVNWSSADATSCAITKNGAAFDSTLSGSQYSGNLIANTTFAITCTNITGSASASVNITVKNVNFNVNIPVTIANYVYWGTVYQATYDGVVPTFVTGTPPPLYPELAFTPTHTVPAGYPAAYLAPISNLDDINYWGRTDTFYKIATLPNGGGTITEKYHSSTMANLDSQKTRYSLLLSQSFGAGSTPSMSACVGGVNSSTPTPGFTIKCSPWVNITVVSPTVPTVSIWASPSSVTYNNATTINWSSSGATSCTITKGGAFFSNTLNGSLPSGNLTSDTTFGITCSNAAGNSNDSALVTVGAQPTPLPTVSIWPDTGSIPYNGSTMMNWASTDAASCTVKKGGVFFSNTLNGYQSTGNLTSNTTFDIACTNATGSRSAAVVVTVGAQPKPTVSISSSLPLPIAYNSATNIIWSSGNAPTSCAVTKGGAAFSNTLNGNLTSGILTADTTFVVTCTNAAGPSTASVIVTVGGPPPPLPTVSIWPDASPLSYGTGTNINWTSSGATTCAVTKAGAAFSSTFNGVKPSGNLTSNTTFAITCSNVTGSSTASALITVLPPTPTPTITVSPLVVPFNGAATVSWTTPDAVGCTITKGVEVWATWPLETSPKLGSGFENPTYTFAIDCWNAAGDHGYDSKTLVVNQNGASCVSLTAPTHVELNETFNVTATMRNIDDNQWKKGGATPHRLGLQAPFEWGGSDRMSLAADTSRNAIGNFSGSFTAPNTVGTHALNVRMIQEKDVNNWWFGPICPLTNTTGNITVRNATLDVQPSSLGFAPAVNGDPVQKETLTISNLGGGTISDIDLAWLKTDYPFTCSATPGPCTNLSIGPGGSKEITISFTPTAATGTYAQTAIITGTLPKGGQATKNVIIHGNVTDKVIVTKEKDSIIPVSLFDFGEVPKGRSKEITFFVRNMSNDSRADGGKDIVITSPSPFSCVQGCTFKLPPKASQPVRVRYSPQDEFSHQQHLPIPSDPSVGVDLKGVGVKPIFKIEER